MTDESPTTADPATEPDSTPTQAPAAPVEATEDAQVFDADYVSKLRQEAAEARVKAKADRERLAVQTVRALAQADGRLVDLDLLAFDPVMLTEDGTVDPDKVTATIDSMIQAKPYLRAVAAAPVTQGYRETATQSSLMDFIRGAQ